jgi:GNAT superfamily N-acetyltransferase
MPDYRGTGLGRDLMVHILTHAKDLGFTESAIEAQVTVIPFYERLGYVAEGPGIRRRLRHPAPRHATRADVDWPGNAAAR